jgi:uncharacterized damage-inducible protein DinB
MPGEYLTGMTQSTLSHAFIDQAIYWLNENTPKIEKCLTVLNEDEVWKRPNHSSNSVGNLILHLCGNITQYIISSLGENADIRERDLEFSSSGDYSKTELLSKLKSTINQAMVILKKLNEDDLMRIRSVQGFEHSGIACIIQVVEHYSYHTGQIIFWTKQLKDMDLGFYAGVDLNKKNNE